jgi:glucose/arabinose dehydrogenase
MKHFMSLVIVCLIAVPPAAAQPKPTVLVTGLKNPSAVVVGPGGKVYLTVREPDRREGGAAIVVIEKGNPVPFTTGLDIPWGMAAFQQILFVVDQGRILKINGKGKAEVFAAANVFPKEMANPTHIAVDAESGAVYVSQAANLDGAGAILRIAPNGKVSVIADAKTLPGRKWPSGLLLDGQSHLLVVDHPSGELNRLKLSNLSAEKLADGVDGTCNPVWDHYGRLFFSKKKEGRIFVISRPGDVPVALPPKFEFVGGMALDPTGRNLLVTDTFSGTLTSIPISIPGHEVDDTPLPLHTEVAFPDLKWAGWKGEDDRGRINPLRPLVLTHAGDGSNRVFVATEQGVIHSFANDQKAKATTVFLDIQDRVSYNDNQNEEGFLGLAFHSKFKENGEFFVFYTTKKAKLTNILSRFKVRKDDPTRADPASEEEIMRFTKPFWNHDGGTLCFGPDGYLYVTHGDGGMANDPFDNGQNLKSLLGKIHRIDVDHKEGGKNYAIPKDNPFVDKPDAKPEIWAYGLRNVWRMAFDRGTGQLWAADVGQNLYEEINLIRRGGNYGWNRREGLHPFGAKGTGPRPEFIEPIWEYHHDVGKSVTGGCVYRGPRLPELTGSYIYGDYVSGKIWALKHDAAKGRVVANRPIKDRTLPIFSFGEDEKGEVYLLTPTVSGQGIYWFVK